MNNKYMKTSELSALMS